MNTDWRRPASILLFYALAARLWAGGSGLNVVVVVNSNSAASVQVGNYYCEKRQVPPQNLLRTGWAGGNIAWQKADFQSVILTPLLSMLSARQLTNQVDYVLLCTDFPYRVMDTTNANSTTTPLFYGFVPDDPPPSPGEAASCSLPNASFNAYAGSELPFRSVAPGTSKTNFLAVMLTSSNLAEAKLVIDRGVASDSTLFTQTVYLGKSDDLRNARSVLFDNAIFNTRVRGNYSMQRTNVNSPNGLGYIGGYENGYQTGIPAPIFVPGALADQLTSFGGELYEQIDHTTALQYLNAGAAGSYGTITEPCLYLAKFPSPQVYFYQARGFTMAECYYQGVTNPYQGLLLGEPLAAPFALPPTGAWNNLPPDALLAGTTNLSVQFAAADANHPVQQVDLALRLDLPRGAAARRAAPPALLPAAGVGAGGLGAGLRPVRRLRDGRGPGGPVGAALPGRPRALHLDAVGPPDARAADRDRGVGAGDALRRAHRHRRAEGLHAGPDAL